MQSESLFLSKVLNTLLEVSMGTFMSVVDLLTQWWVALLIIAALCHAVVEFVDEHVLDKLKDESKSKNAVGTLTIISGLFGFAISALFLVYVQVTGNFEILLIDKSYVAIALFAGALEVIWMIPYLHAIHKGSAINASPLFQLIPVFSLALGLLVFGEQPSTGHIIGGLTIVIGAFVLNSKIGTFKLDRTTILLMAVASLIISVVYFLFKEVVVEQSFVATAFWNGLGMTIMSLVLWGGYRPYREEFNLFLTSSKQKTLLWQTTNEGVNAVGTLLTHLAVAKAPSVMLASSLNAFHPIFTLLIGLMLGKAGSEKHAEALKDSEFYKKTSAIILLAVGTVLIALN